MNDKSFDEYCRELREKYIKDSDEEAKGKKEKVILIKEND